MNDSWVEWHRAYEDPASSLSRRLLVVQAELRARLPGSSRVLSICAGDGRDVLPVMADLAPGARTVLVELDPSLSERARRAVDHFGLREVEVRTADAGDADVYRDLQPVDVLLACGVFGNIPVSDARKTIAALPSLLADDGVVIWTRGRGDEGIDPSQQIRELFAVHGFAELSFTAPEDATFRVGSHRLADTSRRAQLRPGTRLFSFDR